MLNISATLDTGNNKVSCPKPSLPIVAIRLLYGKDLRCDVEATSQLLLAFAYESHVYAGAPNVIFSKNDSVVRCTTSSPLAGRKRK
jgi:hypothetical protein